MLPLHQIHLRVVALVMTPALLFAQKSLGSSWSIGVTGYEYVELFRGTIDWAGVRPREVVKLILETGRRYFASQSTRDGEPNASDGSSIEPIGPNDSLGARI